MAPRLVVTIVWMLSGIVAMFGFRAYTAEQALLRWLVFLWLASVVVVLAGVVCALYGSVRVFLLARQSAANRLAAVQLLACCLLAVLTILDDVFILVLYMPVLWFDIFSVLGAVCAALFLHCVAVLQRELDATLPLTAPSHLAIAVLR